MCFHLHWNPIRLPISVNIKLLSLNGSTGDDTDVLLGLLGSLGSITAAVGAAVGVGGDSKLAITGALKLEMEGTPGVVAPGFFGVAPLILIGRNPQYTPCISDMALKNKQQSV